MMQCFFLFSREMKMKEIGHLFSLIIIGLNYDHTIGLSLSIYFYCFGFYYVVY